ncbi:MAG: Dehydrogenases with different specificities (related to short-chain alcohol dehydrogenases) [uncultured Phycisphaerae bacterium]|uniref:Dehydrogenases with different specificities (Related to short-chain alcohol dehydrogenases) n=1 Tax=uncultured Phycisphaerae bacterium TaxID=904963 RepID=A0A6J4PYU2_9BACT|nr:MAG: Dehydrogenases with different specificities (related to short-chain alcohol dehydrogenases) [uncultured Phycisphaerae bacterium]
MPNVIVITGASSGFGAMSARALADSGHVVYASMRQTAGHNAPKVADAAAYARDKKVDLRTLELDLASQASVDAGVAKVMADAGRIDVIVHNAGHNAMGPSEAFTPEQFAEFYDDNVIGTQRLNRAALPHLRRQGRGLMIWVSSSSARGGVPPYLGPYFAAKAAMDSLAVTYAGELSRWGIETTIVVPGAFTKGTNHFKNSGRPADEARAAEYEAGPYAGIAEQMNKGLAGRAPADADPAEVGRAIAAVVAMPFGKRPLRVTVDPGADGADIVNAVSDRMRVDMLRSIDLLDLLKPSSPEPKESVPHAK